MAKEYPGTILEFERWFRTEEACQDYVARLRWPEGFVCPLCGNRKAWRARRLLWHCSRCRADVSATAGTVFHRSKIPLRLWLRAIWWVTNQKTGVSAMGLQRLLGIGGYVTAWTMLHKLRRAMVRPGRELLSGQVEVDETLVGGVKKGSQSRRWKNIVIIAVEVRGKGMGRVRLEKIPDDRITTITGFVKKMVAPGSEIITDGSFAYRKLPDDGYKHQGTVLFGRGREASNLVLPRVHRIAALLKRWLLGTYQGRPAGAQLEHYLDEFAFRFNRRNSSTRGMLFFRLVQQCVARQPTPYRTMTGTLLGRPLVQGGAN